MTLRQRQSKFALMAAELILKAYEMGYEVTLGDAYRDPRLHGKVGEAKGYGAANSLHKQRLAIDLNLFKNGRYITSEEGHTALAVVWKEMGGTWGGDFRNKDYNHYSLGEKTR